MPGTKFQIIDNCTSQLHDCSRLPAPSPCLGNNTRYYFAMAQGERVPYPYNYFKGFWDQFVEAPKTSLRQCPPGGSDRWRISYLSDFIEETTRLVDRGKLPMRKKRLLRLVSALPPYGPHDAPLGAPTNILLKNFSFHFILTIGLKHYILSQI